MDSSAVRIGRISNSIYGPYAIAWSCNSAMSLFSLITVPPDPSTRM